MSQRPPDHLKRRNSMRRLNYDYSLPGSYFVTICVKDRRQVFGAVQNERMALSAAGEKAEACLCDLERRFPTTLVNCHVVMPNHFHAVIVLGAREPVIGEEGAINRAATEELDSKVGQPKLGEIVRLFKAVSTRAIRAAGNVDFAWQSDYHDRIVRTDRELEAVRAYVMDNPRRWAEDKFNDVRSSTPSPSPPAGRG